MPVGFGLTEPSACFLVCFSPVTQLHPTKQALLGQNTFMGEGCSHACSIYMKDIYHEGCPLDKRHPGEVSNTPSDVACH